MFAERNVAMHTMALLFLILPAAPALSQNRPADPARSDPASGVPQAPVGHRQPNGADVPRMEPKTPADLAREKRDRELDAKLQICRGC
jgi:hypothetical protein